MYQLRTRKLVPSEFYGVYHGHDVDHLRTVFDQLVVSKRRAGRDIRVVWLAGDSSLDNKFWLNSATSQVPACNGMELILKPPTSVADVAAHLNSVIASERSHRSSPGRRAPEYVCINCSVEESTIGMRKKGQVLLPQDEFLKARVVPGDVVVVSLGGNDIALKPTACTIFSMGWLTACSSHANVVNGTAWGLGAMESLVVDDLSLYLRNILSPLTQQQSVDGVVSLPVVAAANALEPPKRTIVLPCMIYYPDENAAATSWANVTLGAIGYNKTPAKVQAIIDRIATVATASINAEALGLTGATAHVEVVPLSTALDGKRTDDYVARVEPSVSGGRRMAELIWNTIKNASADPTRGENARH
ncbi:Hypothetical protein, putative [Bodo saltans]|uniref:Uncharacterized protein n=1 Tax=Bodo saltans TaxID=75058 RepID=A0A0S4KGX1_BODSA|nr:Hypothetical protein, putative [Bodo saltans]|eukprot:CUI14935.1 Hypothetical protein, putative [Bodo saltans]